MNCEEVQPILLDYGKGRVSGPEARKVKNHLESCKTCKAFLEDELAFDMRLSAVPPVEPVNDVWALVRARTKPRRLSPAVWLVKIRSASAAAKRAAAAVAVVGVAAVMFYSLNLNEPNVAPGPATTSGADNVIAVKWSDDPLGSHREALVECLDKM
ncbi:MAG: hypothetical protein QHI38_04470 [Armatimonadota bacterium]|nr:hypothetical protein [Armatimonadota bacterium]